jgi:hypothetical protein
LQLIILHQDHELDNCHGLIDEFFLEYKYVYIVEKVSY